MRQKVEDLKDAARDKAVDGVISFITGVTGALRGVAKAARLLGRKSLRNLSQADVDDLLSKAGLVGVAWNSFRIVQILSEASQLSSEIDDIEIKADSLANDASSLLDAYKDAGCGSGIIGV